MSEPATQLSFLPQAAFATVSLVEANRLLARWGHYLGPAKRPFGAQAWLFSVDGEPLSVAVSASTVSEHIAWNEMFPVYVASLRGFGCKVGELAVRHRLCRGELVELARLCSAPDARWATRPTLRMWREIAGPRWPYWSVTAAVAYSQNSRHDGSLYRFDGWSRLSDDCGKTRGGGTWTRTRRKGDAVRGRKTLWIWRYEGASAA